MAVDREVLRGRLLALGFDEVRFARIGAGAETDAEAKALRQWLATGQQADMHWMERTAEKRLNPALVLSDAKTMIMLGVNYWADSRALPGEGTSSRWARYALHADYHDTLKPALVAAGRVLEELAAQAPTDYRYYVDAGPVLERGWAARAGIGFIGKNSMLISRRHGNWLLLAAIVMRLEIEPDAPVRTKLPAVGSTKSEVGLLCGKCTRCMDACPTAAFSSPGVLDARRCVSYQTIENRGIIPRELRSGIGNRIYGCDTCLEVCPWNRFARAGSRVLLDVRGDIAALTLQQILELTAERFSQIFRGTAVKRLKFAGLLRNACVVAANTGAQECVPALLRLAREELPIVRAHAVWALGQLGAHESLARLRFQETDELVLAEYAAVDVN